MGSVASIAGGIFSWWQYKKAKTAAQEAQNAKDSVLNRQQIGEIEKVIMSAHEAERILIERTSRTTTNRGKSLSVEYTKIQKFISELNEIYESFTTAEHTNPLEYAHKHLATCVKKYNESNDNIYKDAQDMLEDIRSILKLLKKEKSQKEFR